MIEQRYHWCLRRVRRTWWLLRREETRADIALFLLTQGAAYARELARDARREITARQAGRADAR
ncbi:MAG: hypothetical protein AB7F65_08430 [Dehalococcoidia bacterium]